MNSLATWCFSAVGAPFLAVMAIVMIGLVVERIRRAAPCPSSGVVFNVFYLVPFNLLHAVSVPVASAVAVAVTNALGGGLVELPSSGWGFVWAAAAYILTMDFCEYLFHRAQHRLPALWAMHSFHHSDRAMNISTTQRHFWAEQAIKSVTIYLAVGLLFRSNDRIATIYGILSLWNYVAHMNLRFSFGPIWFVLNSPQFHRIHHSSQRQHYDRNFAALFTVFDAIFRTAYVPARGEYPTTGLEDADSPGNLVEAILWPMREWLRRRYTDVVGWK